MEEKNLNKNINYSIELLRLILSFWVVLHHCLKNAYKIKGRFHVATFMIISFYYYYNTLKTKNINKINQRLQRIFIPYFVWPTYLYILNNLLKLFLNDLVLQLIFGLNFYGVFYYLFILIFLTLLSTIISFLFNNSFFFIFQLSLIVAYIIQYSYLSLYFFKEYSDIIKLSLGNIFELLPFAVMGITLRHFNIIQKLKKDKEFAIFYSGLIIFLILKFDIFVNIEGYYYPGIMLNIGGICTFILFSLFSFKNKKLIFLLKIITKFTGGIFYIHKFCFQILSQKILFIKNKTFLGSLVIYIISYITCYYGNKLSHKTKLKFLFN